MVTKLVLGRESLGGDLEERWQQHRDLLSLIVDFSDGQQAEESLHYRTRGLNLGARLAEIR